MPFDKLDGLTATAAVEDAESDETRVDADVDGTVGAISTGVDKMSFLADACVEAPPLGVRLYVGIVKDCSGDANCVMPLLVAAVAAAVAAPPNVVCTKFDEFLNNFVKLLVLNDNKPFDALESATGDVTTVDGVFVVDDDAAVGDGAGAGSGLMRMDFVF